MAFVFEDVDQKSFFMSLVIIKNVCFLKSFIKRMVVLVLVVEIGMGWVSVVAAPKVVVEEATEVAAEAVVVVAMAVVSGSGGGGNGGGGKRNVTLGLELRKCLSKL